MSLLKDDREQYGIGGILAIINKAIAKKFSKSKLKTDLSQITDKDFQNVSREEILDYIETLPLKERLDLYGSESPLVGKFKILDSDKIDFYKDVVNFNKLPDNYKSGDNSLLRAYLNKNDIPEKGMGAFDSVAEFKNVTFFKELANDKIQITIAPSTSLGKKKTKTFTNPTKKQIDDFFKQKEFKQREAKNMGALIGKQKEIDLNNNNEIDREDFELLRKQKQVGGSIDDQMEMAMNQPMMPDEEMEDNYLDFIIDEALDEQEEEMLMSKLEQDEQLSMLFDKVLEVASEFAGSGPVEGPGSGVSDSIPARLSDGEFVFTAKATEEIGASELMRMMKDAEAQADERQGMQVGGMMEEEEPKVDQFGRPIDSDIARDELKKNMMSVNPRYQ